MPVNPAALFDAPAGGLPGVPRIVVGTARLGRPWPEPASRRDAAFRQLDGMLELGCRALDLAASYQIGGTERLVGAWIASRRNRDQLFLITKAGHPYPVVRPNRLSPGALAGDLHASLRRLGVPRVDLFLVHRDVPGTPIEPLVEALAAFHRAGKIGGWGVSNWHHDRIRELVLLARDAGLPPLAASSPHFSLADWRRPPWRGCVSIAGEAHASARAFYAESRIPVLAWSPLAKGFLVSSGDAGDGVYGSTANRARRERLVARAAERGVSPAQLALAYLFHQPFPTHAIVAATSTEKMSQNLKAAALTLTDSDVAWLETGHA